MFSISWYLWQKLSEPTGHPLFMRQLKHTPPVGCFSIIELMLYTISTVLLLITLASPTIYMISLVIFSALMLTWQATVYPISWTMQTSAAIVNLRLTRRHDVMATIPDGVLGIYWAVGGARWHNDRKFIDRLAYARLMLVSVPPLMVVISIVNVMFLDGWRGLLELWVIGLSALLGAYFNYAQSQICALLIAIVASTFSRNTADARIYAGTAFLIVQVIHAGIIAALLRGLAGQSFLWLPVVVIFSILLREIVNARLWYVLTQRLNISRQDLHHLA